MTPKEKAQQIFDKCMFACYECDYTQNAKDCALIVADEVINIAPNDKSIFGTQYLTIKEYWQQVKKEIEKI